MLSSVDVELERRGAALVVHGTRSLQHHLAGVAAILESWGEPEDVCAAGLMHSAYSTDAWPARLYGIEERSAVRDLIGVRAERLVYLFGSIERRKLLDLVDSWPVDTPAITFKSRLDGETLTVESTELRDLIAIHIANTADQSSLPSGFPVAWLSRAAQLATFINGQPVPIFSRGSASVSPAGEEELIAAYGDVYRAPLAVETGQRLAAAATSLPFVAEPFILLGCIALARGKRAEAGKSAATGYALLLEWGTAWDKRLPETSWLAIALFLEQAASAPEREAAFLTNLVHEVLHAGAILPEVLYVRLAALDLLATPMPEESPVHSVAAVAEEDDVFCDDDANLIPDRFAEFLDGLQADDPQRALAYYPGLRAQPWWDPQSFPLVKALEASAAQIVAEFAALDPSSFHAESERIQRGGSWDVFILYERGRKRDERCAAVPITAGIIEKYSTLRTHAGLIYFSRLTPGSIVAPHKGPTNIRLRCHLGIKVPDACAISVDNVTNTWQEGKCIVFDDSFTHAVWNSSDEERVVLIVDMWHPDLDQEEIALLSGLHRYGASVAEGLEKYWEKNDAALVAAG